MMTVHWQPMSGLSCAAYFSNFECVRFIVKELGDDVDRESSSGLTALNYAIESNDAKMVRFLVKEIGADVNQRSTISASVPLVHAKIIEMIRLLVDELGAKPAGRTLLLQAARTNNFLLIQYLLEHGYASVSDIDEVCGYRYRYLTQRPDASYLAKIYTNKYLDDFQVAELSLSNSCIGNA
jgi:ankyrin repeat protein